jgi:hypothetical protein
LIGSSTASCLAGNLNYLAKITPSADRTLMVTLHAGAIALGGGFSALLWGYILKRTGADGAPTINISAFEALMAAVFAMGLFLAWRISRLPETQA